MKRKIIIPLMVMALLALPVSVSGREPDGLPIAGVTAELGRQLKEAVSDAEFDLFCTVVEAEAGCCGEECRRAVASTILNRVPEYGSITNVIYAKDQFSCVWDGGIYRHTPSESTIRICREEMESVSYPTLWFFRSGHYHKRFGTPQFALDNMYFSAK